VDSGFGIVLEVYGLTLQEKLVEMPPYEHKLKWARQVAAALRYLHGRIRPITHGDVITFAMCMYVTYCCRMRMRFCAILIVQLWMVYMQNLSDFHYSRVSL
jgi:hypothetical protein